MKRIAVFVKNLTSGGAEKQSILLAKSLDGLYQIHYIILNARHQELKYLELLAENPTIKVVAFKGSVFSRFIQFCVYLNQQKIECIFSYLTAANFYAVIASYIVGVKKIFIGIRNAYLPPSKLFVDRCLCNVFADRAILNCVSGERYFREKGFKQNKMLVIPNCFENILPFQKKMNTSYNKIQIISVGRFVEQKDYFTALNVIDRLRRDYDKLHYLVIGYGELEKSIRLRIQDLNLTEYVQLIINPPNIAELLEQSDIYLSTSLFEGTSNSIMEAMNADLPIVATNVGDNDKLIVEGKNGFLVKIGNVEQISLSIASLLEDDNLRLKMGKYSKQHLQDHYSMMRFRQNYLNLLRS